MIPDADETSGVDESVTIAGEQLQSTESDWRESLPEDFRDAGVLKKYATKDDAVKALVEVQPLIGAEKVPVLGKDPSPEVLKNYREKMGVPEDPKGYDIPHEGLPEGFQVHQGLIEKMNEVAHQNNIPASAMANMSKGFILAQQEILAEIDAKEEQVIQQGQEGLKEEWGSAYEQNVRFASDGFNAYDDGDQALHELLMQKKIDRHPLILKLFSKIGRDLSEDKFHGKGTSQELVPSVAEAKAKINALRMDKDFMSAYTDKRNPGHAAAIEKMNQLASMAYPGDQPDLDQQKISV